jgi:micrococcal nuclease
MFFGSITIIQLISIQTVEMIRFILSLFIVFAFSISSFSATYQAVVTKISDGDTVWVKINNKKVKLRFLGIDTPEEYPSRKMNKDMRRCHTNYKKMRKLGLLATKHAEELIVKGDSVIVETYGKGYYKRTLAIILLPQSNSLNYNEQMIADGYACLYKYRGHKSKELSWAEWKRLNRLMDNAKRKKLGLWGEYPKIMQCLCK